MPNGKSSTNNGWDATLLAFCAWGQGIAGNDALDAALDRAAARNPGFTIDFCAHAVGAIAEHMLGQEALNTWLAPYRGPVDSPKTIALVPAANVPAVGFHDLLCILAAGHRAQVRLSERDAVLLPWMVQVLESVAPHYKGRVDFVERLHGFDAVLATGSNNSGRYFDHYFGRYPHIIRRNRQSVAVLDGRESAEEMHALGEDLFLYLGLGCRSVGKIFLPQEHAVEPLLEAWPQWRQRLLDHSAYRHNYDYQRTLLLLNSTPHWANDFYMVVESEALAAPLATIHIERYADASDLHRRLERDREQVQIVVGRGADRVAFGEAQKPGPSDYADRQDTMAFLLDL